MEVKKCVKVVVVKNLEKQYNTNANAQRMSVVVA
jgi:hypothetical protein